MSRFDEAFERVVGHEGGFGKDPNDRGNWTSGRIGQGELKGTKYGISAASYPDVDIANLTLDQAKAIYRRDFWDYLNCDLIGKPMDEFLFDFGINSGASAAAKAFQRSVGSLADGRIGARTVAAYQSRKCRHVLRLVFVERAMIMALSPQDYRYGPGWFARLFDKTELALSEAA